ncbi:hypothetical protein CPB97_000669 [Podila verticillata]|nr:hypothetical protein CPB97_000669 [Podila verticillata]
MVRLSLSFLSVASAFAVASAAPFFAQQPFTSRPRSDAQCLRDSSINEYQSFKLWSRELQTYLSGKFTSDRIIGGVDGDKNLEQIEFCAVSSDYECDSILVAGCILEGPEYRLRISRGPLDGYLRVDGQYVRIVSHFEDASLLSFNNDGSGLRIFHSHKDDGVNVLATSKYTEKGQPVVLEYPQRRRQRQRFDIVNSYDIDTIELPEPNSCVPDIAIKEYESFQLFSYDLISFVSKEIGHDVLVGGVRGNKNFQQLEFCIVSTDTECNPAYPTNCIYENVQYRYRVAGPEKGYLRIQNGVVRIVPDFDMATGLNLLWDKNLGVRIAKQNKHSVSVLATTVPGAPLTLEAAEDATKRQWFALSKRRDNNIQEEEGEVNASLSLLLALLSVFGRNECVPEISLREYEPFLLKSTLLNTIVSQAFDTNLVVGGINGDKDFKQLELCLTSTERGCSSIIQSDCIHQNQDYRFRVNAPVRGYLRLVDGEVDIVEDFDKASALSLFKEAGWPLRIAGRRETDGKRVVLAASERGGPITVERPKTDAIRQWFEIIEANYA